MVKLTAVDRTKLEACSAKSLKVKRRSTIYFSSLHLEQIYFDKLDKIVFAIFQTLEPHDMSTIPEQFFFVFPFFLFSETLLI